LNIALQWWMPEGPTHSRTGSGVLVGISLIHWREVWKYSISTSRYCQHDCGHVIAALSYAAAALGWRTRLVEAAADDAVANTCVVDVRRPPAPEMKGNGFSELNRRFPICAYPNDPREYIEGEMRAHGFMQGIALPAGLASGVRSCSGPATAAPNVTARCGCN
jgi:hypothetical protein